MGHERLTFIIERITYKKKLHMTTRECAGHMQLVF
jgi:hypothetical protein